MTNDLYWALKCPVLVIGHSYKEFPCPDIQLHGNTTFPDPELTRDIILSKKNLVNSGEERYYRTLYTSGTEEDYLRPIHNSAVQSLARHKFRTVHHLSRTIHNSTSRQLCRHIHTSSTLSWKFQKSVFRSGCCRSLEISCVLLQEDTPHQKVVDQNNLHLQPTPSRYGANSARLAFLADVCREGKLA